MLEKRLEVPSTQRHQTGRLMPYLSVRPATDARPRLFCFPHAGGSASVFTVLRNVLADRVNVVPVQLPGRERRLRDPLPMDMAALVADLDTQLDPYLDRPYALYGHSMGALVAHDLAVRRAQRGASTPRRLLTGACRALHLLGRLRRRARAARPGAARADALVRRSVRGHARLPRLGRGRAHPHPRGSAPVREQGAHAGRSHAMAGRGVPRCRLTHWSPSARRPPGPSTATGSSVCTGCRGGVTSSWSTRRAAWFAARVGAAVLRPVAREGSNR